MRLSTLPATFFSLVAIAHSALCAYTLGHNLDKRAGRSSPILKAFTGQAALPSLQEIKSLNATSGTFLPLENIQGDILVGMKKQKERFLFFHVNNPAQFKSVLKSYVPANITSVATLVSPPTSQPLSYVNLAFSATGLTTLGVDSNLGDQYFSNGQYVDAANLGDTDTSTWESAFKGTNIHGVFLIGSDETSNLDTYQNDLNTLLGGTWSIQYALDGAARPGAEEGHEHFGFLDGISNPAVSGFNDQPLPGQTIVSPGTILTGRLGDSSPRPSWALDGSFLAFRKYQQKVPEFSKWTLDNAIQNKAGNLTVQEGADYLGARMIGRWKSGAPVDLSPDVDNPALGADPQRNSDFDYSHPGSDLASDQSYCPFSAHIRKNNPRADLSNTDTVNHAIRAGTPYGPETTEAEYQSNTTLTDRGMAFVMYQSDLYNGFRYLQIQWSNTASFPPLKTVTPGIDPIVGQGTPRISRGLDVHDQSKGYSIPEFVVSNGGEYFFSPSISSLLEVIAA